MSTALALDFHAQNNLNHDDNKFRHSNTRTAWKVVVIDDDKMEHAITNVVLKNKKYNGIKIDFIEGYSAEQAYDIMRNNDDVAVIIIDVVMETHNSGLEVVQYIRDELRNSSVRIIIRTGHVGDVVQLEAIREYDVNDYREKSTLTAENLNATVTKALTDYARLINDTQSKDANLIPTLNCHSVDNNSDVLEDTHTYASLGSWEWNAKIDKLNYYNTSSAAIHLLDEGADLTINDLFNAFSGFSKLLIKKTIIDAISYGRSFDVEHQVTKSDGTTLLVRHQGKALIDAETGEVARLLGTMTNARKERVMVSRTQVFSNPK